MNIQTFNDTPVHRVTIAEMNAVELEQFIIGIRARRLRARQSLEAANEVKAKVKDERDKRTVMQLCTMLEKEVATFDKAGDKVETRFNKIMQIKMIAQRSDSYEDA